MAWNPAAPLPTKDKAPRPKRRAGASVPLSLLLAFAVSGCETLERMDYWDRYFEPAPRPAPVAATEPTPNPANFPPATDRNPEPAPVVAMEPIPNSSDRWPATDRPPQQSAARATEPRPDPGRPASGTDAEARTRLLVRQNPWLTRFWMELTPAQRARVERQLRRGDVRLAAEQAEPATVWDPMGLSDRVGLVFGRGTPIVRPAPAEGGGAPALAGNS